MIYLDHNSATKVCQSALDKIVEFSKERYASPFSHNKVGVELNYHLENAYQMIYDFIGADYDDEFVFTSSGIEAVSSVLFGVYYDLIKKIGKTHIITVQSEEAPISDTLQRLKELGCVIHVVSIGNDGTVDLKELEKLIGPKVALISMSWANGLTGVIHPIDTIADICQQNDIRLHVDASYILGKIYLPLNDIPIHYLTFSGDLIHGPKSSGGIVMRKNYELASIQNTNRTFLDVPSLMGLAAACQQCILLMDSMTLEVAQLRSQFEKKLKEKLEEVTVLYEDFPRLPNVSCVAFEKVHAEALVYYLNQKNVFATFGSDKMQYLSNFIRDDKAFSAISFALSRYTTIDIMEKAVNIITESVLILRKMSSAL